MELLPYAGSVGATPAVWVPHPVSNPAAMVHVIVPCACIARPDAWLPIKQPNVAASGVLCLIFRLLQELASYHRDVNVNQPILGMYLDHLLPGITSPGNDNNYGSAAMYDVLCLQALSKRIHCGKFVAEAKFRSDKSKYSSLIRARDAEGIMRTLTNREVELQVRR